MAGIEVRVIGGDAVDRYQYNEVLGAYVDGKLAGAMELAIFKHPSYGNSVTIQDVRVKPEFRRRGVATALYRYARKQYGKITHSGQTDEGAAWVASLGAARTKSRSLRRAGIR